jgi:transcriptional regulator with PAS, ATPase and Fis domain
MPSEILGGVLHLADVVTQNHLMLGILELVRKVANSDLTVLLQGETGTGKKLLAEVVHRAGDRRDRPFVTVDCAALPDSLLESELFGHRKGAFTGAAADRVGLLEEANGGTIFLDEIDKAGLSVQRRFLHMLDSGEVRPVGATTYKRLDVRVVCATSCPDLRQEVAAGRFLKDLFYRLNDISVTVPTLRERPDDVVLLAEWFAERSARKLGRTVAGLSPAFRTALAAHSWPGNVRELEKAVRRAVTLADDGAVLGPELLPAAVLESLGSAGEPGAGTLKVKVEQYECGLILNSLDRLGWNKSRTAVDLGLSRRGLKGKIERYRLDRRRSRR